MVVGEPGIGKTRLCNELSGRAAERGAVILWGRGAEEGEAPAYWPWVQALRCYLRDPGPAALEACLGSGAPYLAQLVPEIRRSLAPVPIVPVEDPEHARFRLFDATTAFLRRAAEARPIVVVLDDLHEADRPTLLLLQFVAAQLHDMRVLVVGTYRESEAIRPAIGGQLLGELARESQRLRLRGLTASDVERFIRATTGCTPLPALVRAVTETTEGNPFFVDEFVRLLAAEGRLQGTGRSPLDGFRIPDEVREAIRRRLGPLQDETRRVLSVAAVAGREFDVGALPAVCELEVSRVVELLGEAEEARIVRSMPPGRYVFSHALMRDTLYEDQGPTARVATHRKFAQVLEQRYAGGCDAHLEELAHHFFQAAGGGDVERAIAYEAKAGRRALECLAYEQAATHYSRALHALALGPADERRECDLLLSLGDCQHRSGERVSARTTFERAAVIARRRGEGEMLVRAALGMTPGFAGLTVTSGVVDWSVVRLLEEALDAIGEGDSSLRARLLGRLAMELYWSRATSRRLSCAEEAVEMARRLGDPALMAYTLSARHVALWTPENVESRLATAPEIAALATQVGDRELALRGRIWRLTALLEVGDLPQADLEFEELQRSSAEPAGPVLRWFSAVWKAMRAGLEGRFDEAERSAEAALSIGRQVQDPDATQAFTAQMIAFRAGRGLEDCEEETAQLVERYTDSAVWRSALSLIHGDSGREPDARREFEHLAASGFADLPRDMHWLVTLVTLSQTCCFLLDEHRAALLYDLLRPFSDRCVVGEHGSRLPRLGGTSPRDARGHPVTLGRCRIAFRDGAAGQRDAAGTAPGRALHAVVRDDADRPPTARRCGARDGSAERDARTRHPVRHAGPRGVGPAIPGPDRAGRRGGAARTHEAGRR